jgi:hypothetical protein
MSADVGQDSIMDTQPLPTIDLSDLNLDQVYLDTMNTSLPSGSLDDVITITASPNLGPSLMTSTTIDWGSINDISWSQTRHSGTLDLTGDDADIRINGVSLTETLQGIQDRLAILRPNSELESRWQQLRDLREQYQALERELQEKEQAWAALQQRG